jgi:hypothetical protein
LKKIKNKKWKKHKKNKHYTGTDCAKEERCKCTKTTKNPTHWIPLEA